VNWEAIGERHVEEHHREVQATSLSFGEVAVKTDSKTDTAGEDATYPEPKTGSDPESKAGNSAATSDRLLEQLLHGDGSSSSHAHSGSSIPQDWLERLKESKESAAQGKSDSKADDSNALSLVEVKAGMG
jgi:hypothetical protein